MLSLQQDILRDLQMSLISQMMCLLIIGKLVRWNLGWSPTLYHVNGCCFLCSKEDGTQLTTRLELWEPKPVTIASPWRPICAQKRSISKNKNDWINDKSWVKMEDLQTLYDHLCQDKSLFPSSIPCKTTGPRTPVLYDSKCGPLFLNNKQQIFQSLINLKC